MQQDYQVHSKMLPISCFHWQTWQLEISHITISFSVTPNVNFRIIPRFFHPGDRIVA